MAVFFSKHTQSSCCAAEESPRRWSTPSVSSPRCVEPAAACPQSNALLFWPTDAILPSPSSFWCRVFWRRSRRRQRCDWGRCSDTEASGRAAPTDSCGTGRGLQRSRPVAPTPAGSRTRTRDSLALRAATGRG